MKQPCIERGYHRIERRGVNDYGCLDCGEESFSVVWAMENFSMQTFAEITGLPLVAFGGGFETDPA